MLDDTELGGPGLTSDIWTSYLTDPQLDTNSDPGWCVENKSYLGKSRKDKSYHTLIPC